MRDQGRRAMALAAVLLLGAGACTDEKSEDSEDSEDVSVAYSANDVDLSLPKLKVAPTGAWVLSASFAWRNCGERACWTFDERQHGGPDVFGVYLSRPPINVESARLTLRTSCGGETTLGRDAALTGEAGAFFLVQEQTGKEGSCRRGGSGRDFNMASGEVEAIVRPVAGAPCEGILSVTAMFGHSYKNTGRDVKVNAGKSEDGLRIDWGDDAIHQFQTVGAGSGLYDCSGADKR